MADDELPLVNLVGSMEEVEWLRTRRWTLPVNSLEEMRAWLDYDPERIADFKRTVLYQSSIKRGDPAWLKDL